MNVYFIKVGMREERDSEQTCLIENRIGISIFVVNSCYETVEILNCQQSFIYLIEPTSQVIVDNCRECTLFVRNAAILLVKQGSKLSITAAAGDVQVSETEESRFYLFTKDRPTILQGSRKILLAPYNALFVGSPLSGPNQWSHPVVQTGCDFSLLDPGQFIPLLVPIGKEPTGIGASLPSNYRRALALRAKIAEERRQIVLRFCQQSPNAAELIQKRISEAFREHLRNSKQGEQLHQLSDAIYL
jgi:hypothetical protein